MSNEPNTTAATNRYRIILEEGTTVPVNIKVGDRVAVTVEEKFATVAELCSVGDVLDSVRVKFDEPFPTTGEDEGWYGAEFIATKPQA
jgi:hypothetical protein